MLFNTSFNGLVEFENCTNDTGQETATASATSCFYFTNFVNNSSGKISVNGTGDVAIPLYIFIWVSILFGVIFLAGVLGNIFIIAVISQDKNMRKSTDLFILNLSVSDLLVMLVCMPTALVEFYAYEAWYFGDIMCKFVPFLENMTVHASVLSIVFISIERYIAICRPLSAKSKRSSKTTVKLLLVIWAVAAASTSPFLWIAHQESTRYFNGESVIVCTTSIDIQWKEYYVLALTAIFFAIPVLLLLIIYARICRVLIVEGRGLSGQSEQKKTRKLMKHMIQRRQTTYMLMAVVLTFFVCMLPFRVFTFWILYGSAESKRRISQEGMLNLANGIRVLLYLNNALNPVLYNVFSTKFKEAFGKCCRTCRSATHKLPRRESGSTSLSTTVGNRDRVSPTAITDASGTSRKTGKENWICVYRAYPNTSNYTLMGSSSPDVMREHRGHSPTPIASNSNGTAVLVRSELQRSKHFEHSAPSSLSSCETALPNTTRTHQHCDCLPHRATNWKRRGLQGDLRHSLISEELYFPGSRCARGEHGRQNLEQEEICLSNIFVRDNPGRSDLRGSQISEYEEFCLPSPMCNGAAPLLPSDGKCSRRDFNKMGSVDDAGVVHLLWND
ncbi:galanin receptor type 2 [Lingula anatina]|uniref:Galanin receptor type 2 n=1 Tax=Lingula anatina TaxID=7574 RepID=A0A1S3HFF1_LINAN|nr:galanin receptor type 2 [Lingula anatina]|eukprot:XP_013384196.1 galanin receptor type 2 [Lingula anatina]